MNNLLFYFLFLILLSSCSFDKQEVSIQDKISKDIFEKKEPIKKELNPRLKVELKEITRGNPFLGNNTNNSGNINFETNFEKITTYKFSSIDQFEYSQPELIFTYANEIIFFDGKGSIFKVNQDLKKIWKENHYNKKERKLNPILYFAQNGQNLIVSDNLSKIYSVNINNGKINWTKNTSSPFNSNIKIFKNTFVTIDFDNVIRCFSISNGKELWNFKTENSFIKSQKKLSLVINGEIVYFINNLGDVTALELNNGSLLWQTPTQSNIIYQNAFSLENSDLVFFNNSIYFSNNNNEFFSIDAKSGIIRWKQTINSSLRPTVINNLIFSISEEGYLFVIDNLTGNIIRITDALKNLREKKENIKPSGFIIAKNKIYLSLNNGRLIKIDIASAMVEKIFKLDNSKISRPYVFNGNMYLIKKNAIIKAN